MKMYYNHINDKMEKLEPEFMALNLPKSKEEYEERMRIREFGRNSLQEFCTKKLYTPEEVLPVVGDEVVENHNDIEMSKLYTKLGCDYDIDKPGFRYCSEDKDTPEIAPVKNTIGDWRAGRELEEKKMQGKAKLIIFEEVSDWVNPDKLEGESIMKGGVTTYSQKNFDYGYAATEVEEHCPCDECDNHCGESDDEMTSEETTGMQRTSKVILSVMALIMFVVLAWIMIHIK